MFQALKFLVECGFEPVLMTSAQSNRQRDDHRMHVIRSTIDGRDIEVSVPLGSLAETWLILHDWEKIGQVR